MYEERKKVLLTFQFHFGLIKRVPCKEAYKHRGYFNSTLVWLKVTSPWVPPDKKTLFQFHFGLIKSLGQILPWLILLYFNSTLVWLKGKRLYRGLWQQLFQFHFGLIKSIQRSLTKAVARHGLFQFHFGLIKRIYIIVLIFILKLISIPLWSD